LRYGVSWLNGGQSDMINLPALLMVLNSAADASSGSLEAWAIGLITLAISTAVTTAVGLIITRVVKKHYKKKDEEAERVAAELAELKQRRENETREAIKQDMQQIVDKAMAPVNKKIDVLMDKVSKTEEGTLSSLRNDILTCYYRCVEKGYRGDWDYENIHHLFEAYDDLHGNSFVKDVMKRFDDLPTKEEYLKQEAEELTVMNIKPKK